MEVSLICNVCALVLLWEIGIIILIKKKAPTDQNRLFRAFISVIMLGVMADVLYMWAVDSFERISTAYIWASVGVYVSSIAHVFFPYIYAVYTLSLNDMRLSRLPLHRRLMFTIPELVAELYILSNIFCNYIFDYKGNGVYERTYAVWPIYVVVLGYLAFCIIYTECVNKEVTWNMRLAVYSCIGLIILGYVFRYIFGYNYENLFIAGAVFAMAMTVEKPEDYFNTTFDVFNAKTFRKHLNYCISKRKKHTVILVYLEEMKVLNNIFGRTTINNAMAIMARFFEKLAYTQVFYLNSGMFAIIVKKNDDESIREMVKAIEERFKDKWYTTRETEVFISAKIMDIRLIKDVETEEVFYAYVEYLKNIENMNVSVFSARNINIYDEQRHIEITKIIQNAVEENKFEIFFQPIYSICEQRIVAAEVLLRLKDEKLGYIPTNEFLSIIEHDGSIIKIGDDVLNKVCRFMDTYKSIVSRLRYLSINYSLVQCVQDNMCRNFMKILETYKTDSSKIYIEIKESQAGSLPKILLKNITYLHDRGVNIAIDSYGSGVSNIRTITAMPVDAVKFDRMLIESATENERGKIILSGSIAMVRRMQLDIVVEGIEKKEQIDYLAGLGVDTVQGYYIGRPVPENEFIKILEEEI